MKEFINTTVAGRYRLKNLVAAGNFGAVFESEQSFFDHFARRVAVKLSTHTHLEAAQARDVFGDALKLAQVMDQITDAEARRHLVHVYDAGLLPELEGRAFCVMEFIDGTDLQNQFDSYKRVPAQLLLKWARQICTAVKGLHNLVPAVLHRDLKPNNVLLGLDRSVRLVDFGLTAKLTLLGFVPGVAGTTAYMAPETTRGESVPASDVYSIGLILYEGLTGKHPFADLIPPHDLPEKLHCDWLYDQKGRIHVPPPSHLNNTVDRRLDSIILECLEFRPGRRYHNAGELLEDLQSPYGGPEHPDAAELEEGLRLKADRDWAGALSAFERGLKASSSSHETRFQLLFESGETIVQIGRHLDAAARLREAWHFVKDTGILRTQTERAELLAAISQAYRFGGNEYQSGVFAKERDKLLGKTAEAIQK